MCHGHRRAGRSRTPPTGCPLVDVICLSSHARLAHAAVSPIGVGAHRDAPAEGVWLARRVSGASVCGAFANAPYGLSAGWRGIPVITRPVSTACRLTAAAVSMVGERHASPVVQQEPDANRAAPISQVWLLAQPCYPSRLREGHVPPLLSSGATVAVSGPLAGRWRLASMISRSHDEIPPGPQLVTHRCHSPAVPYR